MSNNRPQFASKEFHRFTQPYGFEHTTASPHFPNSHGIIDRLTGKIKRNFAKCHQTDTDPNLALLSYHTTQLSIHLASPAELLSGRKFKITLTCWKASIHSDTRERLIQVKQSSAR